MNPVTSRFLRIVSSLQLTVVLLILSMMLVFLATMAQTRLGIWEVMSQYIRTFWVWVELPGGTSLPIFPGGWLLGGLLLVNLVAAHAVRFKNSSRRTAMILIHGGIALLLISELITGLFARETEMILDEGSSRMYTQAPREAEFVVVDVTDPERDRVWSVSERMLATRETIRHQNLPVEVRVHRFYQNARIFARGPMTPPDDLRITHGIGEALVTREEERVVTTDGRNSVTAAVEIIGDGEPLGRWLVSTIIDEPQFFEYDGRRYSIGIRPVRHYKPYRIHLEKFTHDRYPGTEIPRAFSSLIRLTDYERREDREILISMNSPLRYRGETFYQASYANNDTTSILQVVRNPGWLLPYIGCVTVSLGLGWQFVVGLLRMQKRKGLSA